MPLAALELELAELTHLCLRAPSEGHPRSDLESSNPNLEINRTFGAHNVGTQRERLSVPGSGSASALPLYSESMLSATPVPLSHCVPDSVFSGGPALASGERITLSKRCHSNLLVTTLRLE